jgi:hypothetical protein
VTNVAVIVAPIMMADALDLLMPEITQRCLTEHRVYGLIQTTGNVEREYTFGGELLTSIKTFPTIEAAKAWVEHDAEQSLLAPRGGVS